jgi:hypothetical protein
MLDSILLIAIGVIIGWLVPQPEMMKTLTAKIKKAISGSNT